MYLTRNKKCIIKLAQRNFINSKARNVIAVLAMILTTVLFTTLITTGLGAYESIQITLQKQKGSKADADLRYMTERQFTKLASDERISLCGMRRPIGFLSNVNAHNIELDYMDSIEQEMTFSAPTFGAAPNEENEIATTDRALESLGIEPAIGEKVEIEFQLRGQTYKYEMIVSGWWEASNSQISIMLVSDKFMQANEELFPYTFEMDREYAGTYFADVVFRNNTNMENQLHEIISDIGGNSENTDAENYIASAINQVTNPEMSAPVVLVALIFSLLFIFAGYLLIYNIFEISVLQEVQRYGMLKTIGTTQNQIRLLVRVQALWLVIMALPCGLFFGYLLGKTILPFVINFIANEYSNLSIEVSPNPVIFIVASLFTIFTVFISIKKPINIAAGISPMEALRYSGKRGMLNGAKHTKKISLWRLASSNVKRNKKRSIFIVISMTLCCMLLNSTIIIVNSIDIEKAIRGQCAADVVIANGNTFNNTKGYTHHSDSLDEEIVEAVKEKFDIKDEGLIYKNTLDNMDVTFDYGIKFNQNEIVEENGRMYIIKGMDRVPLGYNNRPVCNVYGCNENVIQRCDFIKIADDLSISELYEKLESGNYVIEAVTKKQNQTQINMSSFQCEIGQKISIYTKGKNEKEVEVIAQMGVSPTEYEVPNVTTGMATVGGDGPLFYFSERIFKEIYEEPSLMSFSFNVDPEFLATTTDQLEELAEQSMGKIGCSTIVILKNSMNGIKNTIYIIGVFIGTILGITGFINFINLMITNIITRKKEYAIMQSVGMTTRQIKKLIMNEGFYYALFSSIFGIVLSIVLGGTMIKVVCDSIWFMTYKLVLWPAILLSALTIVLAGTIPVILFNSFDKESIVEKLRKDF